MQGKIKRVGNRQFVKVKYSVDEDDNYFKEYPIPASETIFNEGDSVTFEVEEERYVYDDGSEENIKWAINISLKFTTPFKAVGRTVVDGKGIKVHTFQPSQEEFAEPYSAYLNDVCEN